MQIRHLAKKRTKKISTLIIAMLLAMTIAVPVSASTGDEDEPGIGLRYTYFSDISSGLRINSSGKATCSGGAGVYESNRLVLTLKLYKNDNGYWRLVDSWIDELDDSTLIGTTEYSYDLESGYNYRLNSTCKVYNDNNKLLETVTLLSNEVYY